MVKRKSLKEGFSLFEALVSMLVLSLFFLASTKVISQKQKPEVQQNPHGYYECYYDGGVLKYHSNVAGTDSEIKSVSQCQFIPPRGVAFMNLFAISSDCTKFKNTIEPIFTEKVEFTPDSFYSMVDTNITTSIDEFKIYLSTTNPKSEINKHGGCTPGGAAFISW